MIIYPKDSKRVLGIYVWLLGVLGMQETLASNLHMCHLLAHNVAVVGTAWVMMILLHALAPYVQMLDHALGNYLVS